MNPTGRIYLTSGKVFNYATPENPEMYDVHDIALGLSRQNRYAGHTILGPLTVAEHSLHVAMLTDILTYTYPQEERAEIIYQALMHDATEAYIGDVTRNLKLVLPQLRDYEKRVWKGICRRFKIVEPLFPEVKRVDRHAAYLETKKRVYTNPALQERETWYDGDRDVELAELLALPKFANALPSLYDRYSADNFLQGHEYLKQHGHILVIK